MNEKHPFLSRACALSCAVGFVLMAVGVCFRSSYNLTVKADAQDLTEEFVAQYIGIRTAQIAGAFLAEDLIQSVPATILGIEAAYAAMYIVSDDPTISVTSGNTKYYGGFCYYNGDASQGVYFGSGYINNDARISRVSCTTSDVEFPDLPVNIELICKAYDSNTTPFGVYNGANRGWAGTYYIAENYWGSQGGLLYVDTTVNGDYVRASNGESLPLFIGSASTAAASRLSVSACGATFYSGGIDTNTYLHSLPLTGDMQTDLQIIHDDLEDDFPDDLPLYWVDPYAEQEPTEETTEDSTEETTESGTDSVQPFTLPPEWLETYPTPSIPDPSIPYPSDAVPPTINYEIQRNGLNFWSDLWTELIDKTGLGSYVVILLGLSILEWILWHAGNGGNGKGGEQ